MGELIEAWLNHGIDARDRRVMLWGPPESGSKITLGSSDGLVAAAARALLLLDRTAGDIEFWITTPGFDHGEMFALYDVVRTRRNRVMTVGFGEVCSAGVLILAAGDRRVAAPNLWVMSHAPQPSVDGELPAVDQYLSAVRRQDRRWARLMAKHTRKTEDFWRRIHRERYRELWLDAEQCRRFGIVDEVLEAP